VVLLERLWFAYFLEYERRRMPKDPPPNVVVVVQIPKSNEMFWEEAIDSHLLPKVHSLPSYSSFHYVVAIQIVFQAPNYGLELLLQTHYL